MWLDHLCTATYVCTQTLLQYWLQRPKMFDETFVSTGVMPWITTPLRSVCLEVHLGHLEIRDHIIKFRCSLEGNMASRASGFLAEEHEGWTNTEPAKVTVDGDDISTLVNFQPTISAGCRRCKRRTRIVNLVMGIIVVRSSRNVDDTDVIQAELIRKRGMTVLENPSDRSGSYHYVSKSHGPLLHLQS